MIFLLQIISCRERILALSIDGMAWELRTDNWNPLNISNNTAKIDMIASNQHMTLAVTDGQLFNLDTGSRIEVPGQVVDIACGAEHSVALTDEADVYAWGTAT
jgi:alpha-tubulin suppressor-like RCC1 family protein